MMQKDIVTLKHLHILMYFDGKFTMDKETQIPKKARIADIARLADVGTATVDRVLNGRARVRAATRQRVVQAKTAIENGTNVVTRNKPWRLKVFLPGKAGPSTEYLAQCFQEFGARGNAIIESDEACDDGNIDDGDGCEGDCTLTPSPYCSIVGRLAACTGCHGRSGGFTLGNDLQAWAGNTVNQPSSNNRGSGMSYITSGDKEQSFLWLKVANRQGEAGGMSPGGVMPQNNAWPAPAVELLGQWIDANLPTPENCP